MSSNSLGANTDGLFCQVPYPEYIAHSNRERLLILQIESPEALANVEEISVNPSDLISFPQRGDWVTAWGSQFVVTTVRQPDPYGLVELSLMARAGQNPDD